MQTGTGQSAALRKGFFSSGLLFPSWSVQAVPAEDQSADHSSWLFHNGQCGTNWLAYVGTLLRRRKLLCHSQFVFYLSVYLGFYWNL